MADKLPKAHIPRYENRDKFTTQSDERDKGYIENYLNNVLDPVIDQLVEDSSVLNPQIKKIVNVVQGMDDNTLQMKNDIDYTNKDPKTLVPKSYVDGKFPTSLTFSAPLKREENNVRLIYSPAEFDVQEGTFLNKVEKNDYITNRIVKNNIYDELSGISQSKQIIPSLIELYNKSPSTDYKAGNGINITNDKIIETKINSLDFIFDNNGNLRLRPADFLAYWNEPTNNTELKRIEQYLPITLQDNTNYCILMTYEAMSTDGSFSVHGALSYLNVFVQTSAGLRPTLYATTFPYNIYCTIDYNNNPNETNQLEIITDYSKVEQGVAIRHIRGFSIVKVNQNAPIGISINAPKKDYTDDDVVRVIKTYNKFTDLVTNNKDIIPAINETYGVTQDNGQGIVDLSGIVNDVKDDITDLNTNITNLQNNKQDKLKDNVNIVTLNGQSLLGTENKLINKLFVGLDKVDNTADIDKPVSIETQRSINEATRLLNHFCSPDLTDPLITYCENTKNKTVAKGIYPKQDNDTFYAPIQNWKNVGAITNARTITYNLVNNKKYRLSMNWNVPNTKSFKYIYFTWLGDTINLDMFIESVVNVTITSISVIQLINQALLSAQSTGITITNKSGTTTIGNLILLEELQ